MVPEIKKPLLVKMNLKSLSDFGAHVKRDFYFFVFAFQWFVIATDAS